MPETPEPLAALRREWSLDFPRVRALLAALVDGGTTTELVMASGLARRDVESVLQQLGPALKADGDRFVLAEFEQVATRTAPHRTALIQDMTELAAGLPPSRWRLDHVPATPETMARRALHLAGEYELDGSSVLCLGDHDLTSLAVGFAAPGAELAVVDIDEPILDHIAESAERLGFSVTTAWADLRLTLPPSLVGTADLVFTDPPYTIEGMRLFLTRALEALRPSGHERLAFCFGTGERHLAKALEVQGLLGDLRLALEAMLPGFNRYDGAEAIGARSDLYVCRPTKGARVGEPRVATRKGRGAGRSRPSGPLDARIYTRGLAASEAPDRTLPPAIATAALAAAGDGPLLLVGDGWGHTGVGLPGAGDRASAGRLPDEGDRSPDPAAVGLPDAGDRSPEPAAVGLPDYFYRAAAWATAARPGPFPFGGTPVINTAPDFGPAAVRTLLLTAPERAVLVMPRRDLPSDGLLTAAYDLVIVPAGPGGDPAVLLATRHDRVPANAAEAILRHILLHPGAKIVNAWRDALLVLARDAGTPLTKNEARAQIPMASLAPALRRLRTWELPQSALHALAREIIRSTAV